MAASHSWEAPHSSRHPWESGSEGDLNSDSESAVPIEEEQKVRATESLREVLLHLYFESAISDESFSVLCWYAAKAGLGGEVGSFGFRSQAPTGHYQRHLNIKLGFKGEMSKLYSLPVAVVRKGDRSRTNWQIPVRVPHELLAEEFEQDPNIGLRTREIRDAGELPPNYYADCVWIMRKNNDDTYVYMMLIVCCC